jgi:TPR repeat protein
VRFWIVFLIACGGKVKDAAPPVTSTAPVRVEPKVAEAAKPCVANEECITRCDDGDAESCAILGRRYDTGEDIEHAPDKARAAFERACAKKHPEGCYQLALGWGDEPSRVANFRIACDANHAAACRILGLSYFDGEGVTADPVMARTLADKACELGNANGCIELAEYLRDGTGGPKQPSRSIDLLRKACDDNKPVGCADLAEMYNNGNGVTRDAALARKIYARGCELDAGCNNLGVMYLLAQGGGRDTGQARKLFEKACHLGEAVGCLNLARMWRNGNVHGDANPALAAELYDRACKDENAEACEELVETVAETKAACANDAHNCTNWGYLNEHGFGVPASLPTAVKIYEQACKLKRPNACYNLANIYAKGGTGVTVDAKKGLKLYDQACKLNQHDLACAAAKKLRGGLE